MFFRIPRNHTEPNVSTHNLSREGGRIDFVMTNTNYENMVSFHFDRNDVNTFRGAKENYHLVEARINQLEEGNSWLVCTSAFAQQCFALGTFYSHLKKDAEKSLRFLERAALIFTRINENNPIVLLELMYTRYLLYRTALSSNDLANASDHLNKMAVYEHQYQTNVTQESVEFKAFRLYIVALKHFTLAQYLDVESACESALQLLTEEHFELSTLRERIQHLYEKAILHASNETEPEDVIMVDTDAEEETTARENNESVLQAGMFNVAVERAQLPQTNHQTVTNINPGCNI